MVRGSGGSWPAKDPQMVHEGLWGDGGVRIQGSKHGINLLTGDETAQCALTTANVMNLVQGAGAEGQLCGHGHDGNGEPCARNLDRGPIVAARQRRCSAACSAVQY